MLRDVVREVKLRNKLERGEDVMQGLIVQDLVDKQKKKHNHKINKQEFKVEVKEKCKN